MMKGKRSEIEESITTTTTMVKRCRASESHDDNSKTEKTLLPDLPYHILELIVKRLYFIEQINFRAVCKSFRLLNKTQPQKQTPWIVTFRVLDSKTKCMLKDLKCKKTYTFRDIYIKENKFYRRVVHDSKCGWVLMSKPALRCTCYSFVLYAPFLIGQNNIFELPLLSSRFCIAGFSSNPSHEDCIFIALNSNHNGFVSISTCCRGDNKWRTQHFESDFPLHEVNHVVYFRGIFYCPNNLHGGIVGTYNVAEQNWVVLEPERSTVQTTYTTGRSPWHIHLVKTFNDGELHLVLMEIPRGGFTFPFIPWSYFPGSVVPSYELPYRLPNVQLRNDLGMTE